MSILGDGFCRFQTQEHHLIIITDLINKHKIPKHRYCSKGKYSGTLQVINYISNLLWSLYKNTHENKIIHHTLFAIPSSSLYRKQSLYAIPARPGVITVTQSDGTRLKIRIYGDEYYHYTISEEGYTLTSGSDGDYYYATLSPNGQLTSTGVKARPMGKLSNSERQQLGRGFTQGLRPLSPTAHKQQMMRSAQNKSNSSNTRTINGFTPPERFIDNGFATTGKQKGLVLLAEFPDVPFTIGSKGHFEDMLNSKNYSENGATGSAWQYYYDNSNGRFDPEFVVVGPYTLPHERSYYTANDDELAYEMVVDVCRMAYANGIDFGPYSEAGVMRDVFVFYSGGGEADGSDPEGIWPHRYSVAYKGTYTFGGNRLAGYACAGELSKYEDGNNKFTSIGTFCHEFGHVLGWPDLYDTNYTTNGQAAGPGTYSLMASGSYNNDSRTPPALSILERWMIGWAEPEVLNTSGEFRLAPVHQDKGYLIGTDTDNDYFLLEYRGTGDNVWDIPDYYSYHESQGTSGLLVYHIDYTTPSKWLTYNSVNTIAGHECMKVVCSYPNATNAVYYSRYSFFPGVYKVTSLMSAKQKDFRSWKGGNTKVNILEIATVDDYILLTVDDTYFGMSDYHVQAYQYDALVTWQDNIGKKWTVTWKPTGSTEVAGSQTTTSTECHINGLQPGKQYEVTILNSNEIEHTLSVTTQRKGLYYPRIEQSIPVNSSENPILFHLADCEDIKAEKWYIDGKESKNYIRLETGEHSIQAEITRSDGNKEYIMQYITIQ